MLSKLEQLVCAPYHATYLALVVHEDLPAELQASAREFERFVTECPAARWDHRYAPGKWSVNEVLLHVIQTELIFNFRALAIASESCGTHLPGFDENEYIRNADASGSEPAELTGFFRATRQQSVHLAGVLSAEQLARTGVANGQEVQVEALFYMASGHARHHLGVLRDRYLS